MAMNWRIMAAVGALWVTTIFVIHQLIVDGRRWNPDGVRGLEITRNILALIGVVAFCILATVFAR